ncbi:DUF721 domain-containing protein [Mumia sp. zg.B53]|uniref:DUF721 domain-containing protein n=1 Tax=unclassified Mumia TaxID=2621872 RepID=UPI001C6ECEDD|nr:MULTISPECIES: DciA family protein [unclassified Mumia]MBW9207717.1 DUF721 domain-containing protein [Mumia sp. zg.B17]MBW9209937.1 DUF721 domain-containing protein [Mumia sp. zg.B21]MBW9214541.1 DUF721 domain-containing protein [Mumia sp. zg.B53]MDD9347662.1 DciA family protein [Mumia sp.]
MADDDEAERTATGGGAETPGGEEHQADGIELARSIARAYRSVGPAAPRGGRGGPRRRPRRPPSASGAHPDDRDPQLLESTLDRLVSEHGWDTEVAVHGLFGRWAEIVGAEIAEHCRPDRYEDGQLWVQADSTAWATQLRLLAPNVVGRLNERLGHGTVVRINVRGPQGPSWGKGALRVRGRGPRDTYG